MQLKIKSFVVAGFLFLSACTGLRTRDDIRDSGRPGAKTQVPSQQSRSQQVVESEDIEASPVPSQPEPGQPVIMEPVSNRIPKIGLILGPGGARAYAHIAVLQELQKEKIPVTAVGGIEWGAPIAALYANKGLANEAEWQMSKLKSDDVIQKSLIGRDAHPADVSSLNDFLRLAFGKLKAEETKLPFACPAHNLAKNQLFLMSRGTFDQMLPYCLSYPPTFKPFKGNVSGIREVKMLADHLRSRGAEIIVVINVLGPPNPARPVAGDASGADGVLWNEISAVYTKNLPGVDHVLSIPLGNYGILSYDQHREIMQKGAEKGQPLVRQLARRLGL
jgi:NTE family protein